MSAYNLFTFTISKYPLTKLDEIIKDDQISLRLNEIGSNLGRTIQICTNLRSFVIDLIEKVPLLAANGPQIDIEEDYKKICLINAILEKNISLHDDKFQLQKCLLHFKKLTDVMNEIDPLISKLKTKQSTQYFDGVIGNLNNVVDLYETIISNSKKCEMELSSKIDMKISESERKISHQVAASLFCFDELLIQLNFLNLDKKIQNFVDLNEFIQKVPELHQKLFETKRSDEQQISSVSIDILSELANLTTALSKIQPSEIDSSDFSNVSVTLINLIQILNEIESETTATNIQKIVENLSVFYLEKKPLDTLIETAKTVLENIKNKIEKNFFYYSSSFAVSSYTSLENYIEKLNEENYESNAAFLSSVVRLASRILPESRTGEKILVSLSFQLATLMRKLFEESNEKNKQIENLISKNLEKLDLSILNETNYFLTAALNANNLDFESDEFISAQQIFFVSFSALPIPLSKLASSCKDENVKEQMNAFVEDIKKAADSFSSLFNQLYLTLFSIAHLRSEMISGSLSFPLSLLSSSELKNIERCVSEIKKINERIPQIITDNIGDIAELVNNIIELSKSGNDYLTCIRANAESPLFNIYKISADFISEIIVDIPQNIFSLNQISMLDNFQIFIASLLASVSVSLRFLTNNESMINASDSYVYQLLSPAFTYSFFACNFIEMNPQESSELPSLMNVFRDSLKSIITNFIQMSKDSEKVDDMSEVTSNFKKAANDLLSSILKHKQPALHYDVPDDVQQFLLFDSMSASLQSNGLKSFAHFVLSATKDSGSSDVKDLLNKWFDATQTETANTSKIMSQFKDEVTKLLHDSNANRSSFIRTVSKLSVSLASNDINYSKNVSPVVSDLHKKLVSNACEYLEDSNESVDSQSKLMKIHCCISEISAILPISKLKVKEKKDLIISILKRLIVSLNNIKEKGTTYELDDKIGAIDSIEELLALSKVSGNTEDDSILNDLLEKTVSGDISIPDLNQFISIFSEKLMNLNPSQFSLLDSIKDADTVLDFLYDKAEAFGDNVNTIFQLAKDKNCEDEKISSSLNSLILSSSDATMLVNHSIIIRKFERTPLTTTFVSCCKELFSSLRHFCDSSLLINKDKETNILKELRKINRVMSSQFDIFINIVESPIPQKKDDEQNESIEFYEKKCEVCEKLSLVFVQISRLLALASTSLVTEMYEKERSEIVSQIESTLSDFQQSLNLIVKEAIGANLDEFSQHVSNLNELFQSLIKSSENLKFNSLLVPHPLLNPIELFVLEASKTSESLMLLTDKIIIDPDPLAASKVPDDKMLPHPPKEKSLSLEESYQKLIESKKTVFDNLNSFKAVNENELSSSEEIVNSIIQLRESTDTFIDNALLVSVSTVNPLYQVEQQTSHYALVNALNGVQNSTRRRLMRAMSFKTDMKESLALFESSINKTTEIAESSSKDSQTENKPTDDLTRELNATAEIIEMMSKRLKEFEGQVNMDSFKGESDFDENSAKNVEDIEVAAHTLPAYLIAAADPILSATKKLLERAKKVTGDLLKKFGKIENEKGLINTAKNLSEAAELLLVCAEILVSGKDSSAEFKAITAARIISAAVVEFQCQVLQKLTVDNGEINAQINTVKKYSNGVVFRGEAIVAEKLNRAYESKPKKKPLFVRKLEQDKVVTDLRTSLEKEEKSLKEFRKQQHEIYHSPLKGKKT